MIASATASLRWLRVAKPHEPATIASDDLAPSPSARLVVVGSGMVSQRFCEQFVAAGGTHQYRLTVVGEEEIPAYDRVHLTDLWHGKKPTDLVLRGTEWYKQHDIDLRLGERITELDRETRQVKSARGTVFAYDKLVFATGSRASVPSIPVDPEVEIWTYRTIDDAKRILGRVEELSGTSHAVVLVGGGLLGLEAARSIQKLGCRVIVLEASSQLLPRQLDPDAARELLETVTQAGIEVRLRARIKGVGAGPAGAVVQLDEGEAIEAGAVVATAGARASDEVARESGLVCSAKGGIEVDTSLCTNDPDVFAIGECAAHAHVPHGLVAPGYAMADVLAANLVGRSRRLEAQQAVTRLKLDLTEVNVLGNPLASDAGTDIVWQSPGNYRRLVVNRSRILAAVAVGAWPELSLLQQYVADKRRLKRTHLDAFRETGNLGLTDGGLNVESMSDRAVVCQCAGVTCGALRTAMNQGHKSPEALARVTLASTLCGTCKPLVAALAGAEAVPAPRANHALIAAAIAAFVLAWVVAITPRVPLAASISEQGFELAFIDPLYKQVTGFTILGLVLAGLMISARKRISRFRIGSYSGWRVLHGALGVGGLVALFAHTGFRLGDNLNLALMVAFLLSALTGAVAGVSTGLAPSTSESAARRFAKALRSLHDYAFWPLGVLLVFHVIKVYYY